MFSLGDYEEKAVPGQAGELWDPGVWTASHPQEMVDKRVLTLSTVDIWGRVIFCCGSSCTF